MFHHDYIAHAGGAIDGYTYTNSLEAVENAIKNGINYIELDLALTSDSVLVASHDWKFFKQMAGIEPVDFSGISLDDFKKARLYGRYTPLTYNDIIGLLEKYPHISLVTDKISDYDIIYNHFGNYSHRVVVECFSKNDYHRLGEKGFHCFISSKPSSRFMHGIKELMNPITPVITKYVTSVELYEESFKDHMPLGIDYFFNPADCEIALYGCDNREGADSLFLKYPNARFVYIDNVEGADY